MQTPETPSTSSFPSPPQPPPVASIPQPPQKKSKVLPILLGCGCGVPILAVILFIIAAALSPTAPTSNTATNSATPKSTPGAGANASLEKYLGKWQGSDGTSVWIRGDGKGDYDGGNTKVSGGGVTVDESAKTLAITSFFGIGKTFKIDAPPKAKDGQVEMKLNGVLYRRSGGFDTSGNASSPANSGAAFDETKIPAPAEQRRLADETVDKFDDALENGDFKTFHKYCSQAWQEQDSPEEMRTAFKQFLDKKLRVADALNHTPTFTPAPKIGDNGWLVLQGFYPSAPLKIYFEFSYVAENNAWKLAVIHIKTGSPFS